MRMRTNSSKSRKPTKPSPTRKNAAAATTNGGVRARRFASRGYRRPFATGGGPTTSSRRWDLSWMSSSRQFCPASISVRGFGRPKRKDSRGFLRNARYRTKPLRAAIAAIIG
jgi:hypothetical protein